MARLPTGAAARNGQGATLSAYERRRVVLWRHGRTSWNVENRFQGHSDIPLDDVGQAQAAAAAQALGELAPSLVVSSDLGRAMATAQMLVDQTGAALVCDPRLRETDGGTWEGRRADEILATDGDAYRAWRLGEKDIAAGGAEPRSQVADRATAALQDALVLVADAPAATIVLVTHGGTARALLGRVLGLPFAQWRVLGGLANASWSVLEAEPWGWRLTEHNAMSLPQPVVGDDR